MNANTTVVIAHWVSVIHGHLVHQLCNVIRCSMTVVVISSATEKIAYSTVSIANNITKSARKLYNTLNIKMIVPHYLFVMHRAN